MGRPFRRRIAPVIRIRQEIDKRLDPLFEGRAGPSVIGQVLEPAFVRLAAEDTDELRGALAARSASRYPLTHLARRDVGQLPAQAELRRSIDDVARGTWSVFGMPIRVDTGRPEWTRHPLTNTGASDDHWTRVPYMNGVGGGDVKAIWDLNRHHELLRLAQGFHLDRDESRVESLLVLLEAWLDQNPPGRGINWVSSLEVAFRAIAWCWIWALTCESRAWTPLRTRRFLTSLWRHARHVERFDSIHHSPNTHLTGEGLGLLYVGALVPELACADRWRQRGREILESELDEQVLDDGMHFERAVGYHRYTAEFYVHYLLLASALGISIAPSVRDRIHAQIDVARALRRPDGTWPIIGDEDSGDTLLLSPSDPHDQGPLLAVGGALFGDPAAMSLASDSHRAAGWWLLPDAEWETLRSHGQSAVIVDRAATLPAAGYFVGRDGEGVNDWWCLVDAGPHGGERTGHAHTDLGHVEIAHGSTHIVADPGCVGYTIDIVAREHCRSESAHACLVVENAPLASPRGPFSWSRVAPVPSVRQGDAEDTWWCELSYAHADGARRLTHRRQVVLVRGHGVVVCDWVEGDVAGNVAVHWPLARTADDLALDDASLTGDDFRITWGTTAGHLEPTVRPAVRALRYGHPAETASLRLTFSGALPAAFITCFASRARYFRVGASSSGTIRVIVPSDQEDERSTLVVRPGGSPVVERTRMHATSQRANG